ncbi:MAG: hypothetical protein L3J03_03210, partial [Desulfobacterales bacterium]|nr:hypothetical protein [Desulfobacterales bacterium]
YGKLMPVSVYQWLRFVHSGLRSILVLFEQARMGEDEVLVNAYPSSGLLRDRQCLPTTRSRAAVTPCKSGGTDAGEQC